MMNILHLYNFYSTTGKYKLGDEGDSLSICTKKILNSTLKSVDPAASKMLFGCQSKVVIVERIGFLMCLLTHQLFSCSK